MDKKYALPNLDDKLLNKKLYKAELKKRNIKEDAQLYIAIDQKIEAILSIINNFDIGMVEQFDESQIAETLWFLNRDLKMIKESMTYVRITDDEAYNYLNHYFSELAKYIFSGMKHDFGVNTKYAYEFKGVDDIETIIKLYLGEEAIDVYKTVNSLYDSSNLKMWQVLFTTVINKHKTGATDLTDFNM